MKLNIWAPGAGSRSEATAYAAEQGEALSAHASITHVSEAEANAPPDADLDLYHLANSAEHGFVYRAALTRPGVALLHQWNLHDLARSQTVDRGDAPSYLREMRRAHGEAGAFVAQQIIRGRGGEVWPARYPMNQAILSASLGVVAPTPFATARAALQVRGLPVMELPRHVSPSLDLLPSRAGARRELGLEDSAFVVTALGLMTPWGRDIATEAIARVRSRHPQIALVALDSTLHIVAADVVLALRSPDHGGVPGGVVNALGLGRATLVTGGTDLAGALPEGVVMSIDPGRGGVDSLEALLSRLVEDTTLRESLGRAARAHMVATHDLKTTARALADFLQNVFEDREGLRRA
ncbi:MAG: hypothetical protein ABI565_01885, partial [Vicinamibacteria bacterium]